MASSETLMDKNHNVLGYIEDRGEQMVGMDKNHRILGYYEKNNNRTVDQNHNLVGSGNLLSMLIYKA